MVIFNEMHGFITINSKLLCLLLFVADDQTLAFTSLWGVFLKQKGNQQHRHQSQQQKGTPEKARAAATAGTPEHL
jgi:hypothetical protein